MKKMVLVFMMTIIVGGCTPSIHLVHSDRVAPLYSTQLGKLVKAQGEQNVIMGVADITDYVEIAHQELERQCPNGEISGLTTHYSTNHRLFSWTNRILLQGYCQQAGIPL